MADPASRSGTTYGTAAILQHLDALHAAHDPALAAAYEAPERESMPSIQLGPSEGRLLELLASLTGARRAVEIGTLAGYSAIRLARGMGSDGRLWTIEHEPRHAEIARARIAEAGLDDRVEVVVGDGLEALGDLEARGPFDLVFLDADKGRYDQYGRWAYEHLAPRGLLIADNVYLFGRLLADDDPEAEAMRRFHREAAERLDTVCVPTPDGLLLGRNG